VFRKTALVSAAALLAIAAGCGSSSKSSSSATTAAKSPGSTAAGASTTAAGSTGTTAAAPTGEPFLILTVLSVGAAGATGEQAVTAENGMKAAVNVVNANGGANGHPVKLEVLDDTGNTTTGVGLLQQRLQSGTKPNAIVPGSNSTEGVAYVPIATQAGIVSIGTPSASQLNDPSKYPYNFLAPPPQQEYVKQEFAAAKAEGAKKVAVLSSTSAFGTAWAKVVKDISATPDGLPATFETYNDTDLDMTAQLQRLQATNPDILFLQGFGEAVGHALDSRVKLGWNIPVYCESTCGVTPLVTSTLVGTPQAQGLKIQVPKINVYTPPDQATQAQKDYLAALKALGPITGIQTQYSFQYDSVVILATAATQSKSSDPKAIAKQIESLQQPSTPMWVTLGAYHYSPTSHAAAGSGNDFVMVVPTHLVDGQVGAPGA
jgi:branched-chain amino acid transport system substrate-binding protein